MSPRDGGTALSAGLLVLVHYGIVVNPCRDKPHQSDCVPVQCAEVALAVGAAPPRRRPRREAGTVLGFYDARRVRVSSDTIHTLVSERPPSVCL